MRLAEPARAAVVMAHPHPPQGGTMHHPVLFHSESELHRSGFTTLRFNFRGVEGREGSFDDGRGELDDLAAAVAWMRREAPFLPVVLVGYSFGAWCAARLVAADQSIEGIVAIQSGEKPQLIKEKLKGFLAPRARAGEVKVLPAWYELATGAVTIVE